MIEFIPDIDEHGQKVIMAYCKVSNIIMGEYNSTKNGWCVIGYGKSPSVHKTAREARKQFEEIQSKMFMLYNNQKGKQK